MLKIILENGQTTWLSKRNPQHKRKFQMENTIASNTFICYKWIQFFKNLKPH